MDTSPFWLISINDSTLRVSYVSAESGHHTLSNLGPVISWDNPEMESFISAIDESLSSTAQSAGLSPEAEPSQGSFVLPPFWVGGDGKIEGRYFTLIENACKKLNLKPMGFISHDEVLVEHSNMIDGFPASFILLNFDKQLTVSLVYMGKINQRFQIDLKSGFDPVKLEQQLMLYKTDSALPPQIIITGTVDPEYYHSLTSYPWVGKKVEEIFLHFPDIKLLEDREILDSQVSVISSQTVPNSNQLDTFLDTEIDSASEDNTTNINENNLTEEASVEEPVEEPILEPIQESVQEPTDLHDVSAKDLGFSDTLPNQPIMAKPVVPIINDISEISSIEKPTFTFKIPKINKPKLSFKINFQKPKLSILSLLAIFPLFIFIFLIQSAELTIFVTPFQFNQQSNVILDTSISDFSSGNHIPADKQEFSVSAESTRQTTGKKTVGEKAKGSVLIYNKQSKSQNLPQGTILSVDGKSFLLTTAVSVQASSSDLDAGVINLGKTKAVIEAVEIGPEYNLAQNTQLTFKDYSEALVLAKVDEPLTGGTKKEINAVSQEDKTALESEIKKEVKNQANQKIETDLKKINGILSDTIQVQLDKIEYNREVGEEANELSASVKAVVSVFALDSDSGEKIISSFLSKDPNYSQSEVNPADFKVNFAIQSIDDTQANGTLSIEGNAIPLINKDEIAQKLSGKNTSKISSIIKSANSRIFDYHLERSPKFFNRIIPLPVFSSKIKIIIRSEL